MFSPKHLHDLHSAFRNQRETFRINLAKGDYVNAKNTLLCMYQTTVEIRHVVRCAFKELDFDGMEEAFEVVGLCDSSLCLQSDLLAETLLEQLDAARQI